MLFYFLSPVLDLVAFGDHTMERPNAKLHCEEYLGWTSNVFVDSGDLILFVKLGAHLIGPLRVRI